MYFRYFVIISPWKGAWPFIWTNLNSLCPRMLCAKFSSNWQSGPAGENLNIVIVFSLLSPLGKGRGPSFEQIWIPFHPRILCAKFGWNGPSGSGEDKNVKSLRTGKQTDDRRSEKLTWALSSGELKMIDLDVWWVVKYNLLTENPYRNSHHSVEPYYGQNLFVLWVFFDPNKII